MAESITILDCHYRNPLLLPLNSMCQLVVAEGWEETTLILQTNYQLLLLLPFFSFSATFLFLLQLIPSEDEDRKKRDREVGEKTLSPFFIFIYFLYTFPAFLEQLKAFHRPNTLILTQTYTHLLSSCPMTNTLRSHTLSTSTNFLKIVGSEKLWAYILSIPSSCLGVSGGESLSLRSSIHSFHQSLSFT